MLKNTNAAASPDDKGKKRKLVASGSPSTSKGESKDEDKHKRSKTYEEISEDDFFSNEIENGDILLPDLMVDKKSAFDGCMSTYKFTVNSSEDVSDVDAFFELIKQYVCRIFTKLRDEERETRAIFQLTGTFLDNEYSVFDVKYTVGLRKNYSNDDRDVESYFQLAQNQIKSQFEKIVAESDVGSKILHLNLHINETRLGTRSIFVSPMSFKWAVLEALHEADLPDSVSEDTLQEYSNELVLDEVDFPVKLDDLPRIEEMNNISFNVFIMKYNGMFEEIQGPVRHTEQRREKHINLLLERYLNTYRYSFIRDLAQLVDSNKSGQIICDGCLCFFESTLALQQHQTFDCLCVKTVLAPNAIKFVENDKNIALPIVVYADFEALLEPVENNIPTATNNETFSVIVKKHVPYCFAFYIKCHKDNSLSCLRYFSFKTKGQCEDSFIKELKLNLEVVLKRLKIRCDYIPIFIHNLSNYDGHFIIKGINAYSGKVNILGDHNSYLSIEKTIEINNNSTTLRFLDSYKFLDRSLQNLSESLTHDRFHESRRHWNNVDDETFTLLTQKGVFPYEFLTSFTDLKKAVPKKEYFYDSLKARHISDDEYKRVLKICEIFNCKNMLDYAMLYLRVDVLVLTDLFENLRRICLDAFQIDPARYYTMSSVSWDVMLKVTDISLQPLPKVDMMLFLKKANRGGIAHCTQRHAVANNKYLASTFDKSQNSSYLMYYDANNLYGWAMSQPLPYDGFEWLAGNEADVNFNLSADSEVGYFLEVDLEYPNDKELHDQHADYPFCPEKKKVHGVSDKQFLISDLTSKKKYILHHSILSQCVANGLRLLKIHRVLKFKQKPWLKPFVDLITNFRINASTDFDKDFYKGMINNVYGKSIQAIEKYKTMKLLNNWDWEANKFKPDVRFTIESPEYENHFISSKDLVKVQLKKIKLLYNTPTYIGYAVQDLSKFHMYDFHYGFMKRKFGKNIKLLYTDTDSFLYQIFTEDYYDDMRSYLSDYFDTSDYPEENQFGYRRLNKKRLGLFKDECKGTIVKEFVALRPKVYVIDAGEATKKAAASAPRVIRDQLTVEDYKRCLFNKEPLYKEFSQFQADGFDLFTKHVRKAVLLPTADFKRHYLENDIDSLPFGHYKLNEGA